MFLERVKLGVHPGMARQVLQWRVVVSKEGVYETKEGQGML